ncbi:hypothetical protein [Psychrosphaera haliotis]|uniref:Uncharacterized protein n=1 Tax=Psychrosphaera haliotis TaxID=555083 RepID=A0A6N8FAQ2_9GAMM|nr:hypothetical protein [Psychrosphaera haliotis]MUH73214.1 hypothetical protein [Psychrosphaera haliotis]
MKKGYILACFTALVMLHEDLNHLFVMLIIGNFEFQEAWNKAFGASSVERTILTGSFRLIPLLPLILLALCTNLLSSFKGQVALWLSLATTVLIISYGYWHVTEALYTDQHASSTSAIGYLWAPVASLIYSFTAGIVCYLLIMAYEAVSNRA